MSLEYIRRTYKVPMPQMMRGKTVAYFVSGKWQKGRILSANNRLWVRLELAGRVSIHPEDPNLKYTG